MKSSVFRIIRMKTVHVKPCEGIVRVSDPWKRLDEGVDFRSAMGPNRTNTAAYVCISGMEVAGFVLFIPEPVFARGGYLRAIAVSPDFRGKGVGRKLLSFAEKMTSKRALHFFLCASSFNRSAHRFYTKCGYVKVGNLPGLIRPRVAEHIYWKRLKSTGSKNRDNKKP